MILGKDCDCGRIVYFDTVKDTEDCAAMEESYNGWMNFTKDFCYRLYETEDGPVVLMGYTTYMMPKDGKEGYPLSDIPIEEAAAMICAGLEEQYPGITARSFALKEVPPWWEERK